MSENIQPTSEENKIVESSKKDNLSKNPSGANIGTAAAIRRKPKKYS